MPKFFVPLAGNREQSERVWKATKEFLEKQGFPTKERRIFSISYTHEGRKIVDEVDKLDRKGSELILALLESDSNYLCCTLNQGCARGKPIIIKKTPDTVITNFD